MGWSASLDKVFVASQGKLIKTLADARDFLLKLPKARHKDEDVQAAIEAVLMAAEGRGPILHATAGIGTVLNGRVHPTPSGQSKHRHPKPIWKSSLYS